MLIPTPSQEDLDNAYDWGVALRRVLLGFLNLPDPRQAVGSEVKIVRVPTEAKPTETGEQ